MSMVNGIVDVVPLMKAAGGVKNSGHCIYSIGLKCFLNCLSVFHLVFHIYIYMYDVYSHSSWKKVKCF